MPKMPRPKSKLWEFIDSFGGKKQPMVIADYDDLILADYVVCVSADDADARRRFPDNVFDFCKCGEKLQLRPHVPSGPERICYGCAAKLEGNRRVMISQKTADDSAPYMKKNRK